MKVCSGCANVDNGKMVQYAIRHSSFFTEWKQFIDDKRVVLVHYPNSKRLKCDWCGEMKNNLWRDDHFSLRK